MKAFFLFMGIGLVLSGAGCTNPLAAVDKNAGDIDAVADMHIVLEVRTAGIDNPLTQEDQTQVDVRAWGAEGATFAWTRATKQETEESKNLREAALSSPVGTDTFVPEPVYEEVTLAGTVLLGANGLATGTRVLLPALFATGEVDMRNEGASGLWLSRAQYDALVNTRSATVTFGGFDTVIAQVLGYYDQAGNVLDALRGGSDEAPADAEVSASAFTTLTAQADWGSAEFMLNGEKVRVQTVVAENAFARIEVLANADHPLILSVVPRPASWLMTALETLSADHAMEGYEVKEITIPQTSQPSVDQPQPQAQQNTSSL